jgi:DNA-directed RNA polymerase subunit RPC12/RpoP
MQIIQWEFLKILYISPAIDSIMDNLTFETEYKAFHCMECNELIRVDIAETEPRPISCERCNIVYMVSKKGNGLSVTVVTDSEPDIIAEEERNLEENDE